MIPRCHGSTIRAHSAYSSLSNLNLEINFKLRSREHYSVSGGSDSERRAATHAGEWPKRGGGLAVSPGQPEATERGGPRLADSPDRGPRGRELELQPSLRPSPARPPRDAARGMRT
jgi:hypothetical protein